MAPLSFQISLYLVSAVGSLFLAILVSLRARRAHGALPLTLLNLALFVWCLGEAMRRLTSTYYPWISFDNCAVTLTLPSLLLFVNSYCQLRLPRRVGIAVYSILCLFGLVTLLSFVSKRAYDFMESPAWNVVCLCLAVPVLVWSVRIVLRRRRATDDAAERVAMMLVAIGVSAGFLMAATELLPGLDIPVPKLGHVGCLIFSLALTFAVLRHHMAEGAMPFFRLLALLAAAIFTVLLNIFVIAPLAPQQGFAVLGGAGATFALFALYRLLALRFLESASRQRHLASIGTMAASVAHEIKNPLTSIKGAVQLLQHDLKQRNDAAASLDYLGLVVTEVDRLNRVVEEFLAFARPQQPRRRLVALNPILGNALALQRAALSASIKLEDAVAPALPSVNADPDHLQQALINVLKNAVEAVGEAGTVSVTAKPLRQGRAPGVAVQIDDTGPGLSAERMAHLFEPFHTSKPRGSGLGLAITRRILEAHGGSISVANRKPSGARVTLWLPEAQR